MVRKINIDKLTAKIEVGQHPEKIIPSSPIGVFDSGVGGLTVLAEVIRQLPHEDVVYLADTARIPYGSKSAQEIITINRQIVPYLIKRGVKLIIIACGTSSAIAYPVLKDEYPVEQISMIEPGSQAALAASRVKKIGLIATEGTVASQAYQNRLRELDAQMKVYAQACPRFVPLIEAGEIDTEQTRQTARAYLQPLLAAGIDTLILGCTHYPHLLKVLTALAGPNITMINPAQAAVTQAKELLLKAGTYRSKPLVPKYDFLVTGEPLPFERVGTRLLERAIVGVKQVYLDN